ncbi:DUF4142 domain-containing protein [Pedobacter antarcticus]|uniref:DUF4142 domain-containing protein n=1 Tax=Pedobacter antarcticus TaxID=34086 RepID=UPI00088D1AF1|nr:DUF4142 domain-containing protein [Pedobacter antarcticus]SDM42006.1 Predicted outer membrane protein [Pedobacter antarcticus]
MKKMRFLSLIILVALGIQSCRSPESRAVDSDSTASDSTAQGDSTVNDSSKSDGKGKTAGNLMQSNIDSEGADFMKKAGANSMWELQLADIAAKSSDPKIKDFAMNLKKYHTQLNKDLKNLSGKLGIVLPTGLTTEEKTHLENMRKTNGQELDKHYIGMVISDHEEILALFKAGASNRKKELSEFAIKAIPTIESHFEKAKALQAQLK